MTTFRIFRILQTENERLPLRFEKSKKMLYIRQFGIHNTFWHFFEEIVLSILQIENEYGAFGYDDFPRDTAYLESLKDALGQFGIESLLFTSDSPKGTQDFGSIPGGTY